MLTYELLLQSPRFIAPSSDNASLPAQVHAVFTNGQPFLYDDSHEIALHSGPTDWIICDAFDIEDIRLISYESFFDNYQPENEDGWNYLAKIFNNAPDHQPSEPVADEEVLEESALIEDVSPDPFHADNYVMEKRLLCDCGGHELSVRATGDMDGDIEIAFWNFGCHPYKPKLSERLRQIWDILTKGHAYSDMVRLNKTEQAKLVDIITESSGLSDRYKTARRKWLSRSRPAKESFTLQEVADLQANHEADKQELLEMIESLSVRLQPQSQS